MIIQHFVCFFSLNKCQSWSWSWSRLFFFTVLAPARKGSAGQLRLHHNTGGEGRELGTDPDPYSWKIFFGSGSGKMIWVSDSDFNTAF